MERVSLYYKSDEISQQIASKVSQIVTSIGLIIDDDNPEAVIVIGGDGTFLRAIHKYIDSLEYVSFLGINTGTLGFFCEFGTEEVEIALEGLKHNKLKTSKNHLLGADIITQDGVTNIYAVNEIRIENPFHTLTSNVYINDEEFETFRGNGLVVSSALGSSAYNKSLHGAVVDPRLETLQLVEIASITNSVYHSFGSPLILPSEDVFTFKGDFKHVIVGYDYQTLTITGIEEIKVYLSDIQFKCLHNPELTCLSKLKESFIK